MKWGVCLFVVACALVAEFSQCQSTDGYGTDPSHRGRGRGGGRGRGQGRGEWKGRGGHRGGHHVPGELPPGGPGGPGGPVEAPPGELPVPRYRRDASAAGGRSRARPERSNSTLYRWTRNLSDNITVQEAASSLNNKQIVIVMSYDVKLLTENITRAATLYHFSDGVKYVVVKPRLRVYPCFLIDTSLTYDEIIAELKSRNDSAVTVSSKIALDATGPGLDDDARAQLFNKTTALAVQCKWRNIVQTKPVVGSPPKPEADTKELTVLTLEQEVTLTVPAKVTNTKFRRPQLRGRPHGNKRTPK